MRKKVNPASSQSGAADVVSWLDTAGRILNADHIPHFEVSIKELEDFMRTVPPPPSFLTDLWAKSVWPMQPGEPFCIFLVRALSSHFAVTCLSPRLRVVEGSQGYPLEHSITPGTFSERYQDLLRPKHWTSLSLCTEVCRIVGLRLYPYYTSLVQSGWALQCCPDCVPEQACSSRRNEGRALERTCELSQGYGGNICSQCRRDLPLHPLWSRQFFLVLQRQDGTRCAAVAYNDDLYPMLQLGHVLRALLYVTRTEQGDPLVVLHNATASLSNAEWVSSNTSTGAAPAATGVTGRGFLSCSLSSQLPYYGPFEGPVSMPRMSLPEWCRLLTPEIVGQDSCKHLVFLSVIDTLYRAVRRGTADSERLRPLHVLLVGPTKSGKSALLRDIASLYDNTYATLIRPWHGNVGAMTSTAEYGLGASLPSIRGNVLMCGVALENIALMLDETVLSTSCMAMVQQILEDGNCGGTITGTGTPSTSSALESIGQLTLLSVVQVMASIHEESSFAFPLARCFPLVACVSPQLNLAYSVSIGQNVIAASAARTLSSRGANSQTSSSHPCWDGCQNGRRTTRLPSTTLGLDVRLDLDTLIRIARSAPDEKTLYAMLDWPSLAASYLRLLQAHRHLVGASIPTPGSLRLPIPASCRGQKEALRSAASTAKEQCNLDDSLQAHLRVLGRLSVARLVLEGGGATGWSPKSLREVWDAYAYHLHSLAHLLDTVAQKSRPPSQFGIDALSSSAGFDGLDRANGGFLHHGTVACKRRRGSRKSQKLQLVELLRGESALPSSSGTTDGILTTSRIEALYSSLGGLSAMGDSFDVVLNQLQQAGLLIRRPGGWQLTNV